MQAFYGRSEGRTSQSRCRRGRNPPHNSFPGYSSESTAYSPGMDLFDHPGVSPTSMSDFDIETEIEREHVSEFETPGKLS